MNHPTSTNKVSVVHRKKVNDDVELGSHDGENTIRLSNTLPSENAFGSDDDDDDDDFTFPDPIDVSLENTTNPTAPPETSPVMQDKPSSNRSLEDSEYFDANSTATTTTVNNNNNNNNPCASDCSFRSNLDGDNSDSEKSFGSSDTKRSTKESESSASHVSIAELLDVLRQGEQDLSKLCPHVRRRVRDFRYAQKQRRKQYTFRPYGIVGLFANLSDIRSDLRWAEDAAWRREHEKPYISWHDFEAARSTGLARPYFTYFLIVICVSMMIVEFYFNHWKFEDLRINPLLGPSPETLLKLGALQTKLLLDNHEWWRLITPIFLHAGLIHIVVNVFAIYCICGAVELNHGPLDTSLLFFVPAIGGNIISAVMQPGFILIGASGGIFGSIGVCVADIALNWKLLFLTFRDRGNPCRMRTCSLFWLVFDIAINSIIGFTPYVDNFAHLGGLIYGFLIGLTVLERLPLSFFGKGSGICHKIRICSLRFLGILCACALVIISAILLGRSNGVRSPCWDCRYISCAPFPFWTDNKWWYCDGCDAATADVYLRGTVFGTMDLYCPRGGIVQVDIANEQISNGAELQPLLPGFCRAYC